METYNEEFIACNRPKYSGPVSFRLNTFGDKEQNIYPHVDLYYANFDNLTPRLVDFIEIATFIYLTDQHIVRCQGHVDEHGLLWRRKIHLIIGVRDVEFWQQKDVVNTLVRLLRFLSDDFFSFEFTEMEQEPPAQQMYFHFNDTDGTDIPTRVMLFSGGLDSLGGAIKSLITEGKRTILVRHITFINHSDQFKTLERELSKLSEGRAFFFSVRTGSNSKDKKEYTQRCRSILYFAMGATISHLVGLNEVFFYENGPVSINLALNPQVVGGRATKTTHPQTLFFFQKLFRLISGKDSFTVQNPFWNKTKAEIVDDIVKAECGHLIKFTMSCAHTWMQDNITTHCGVCSQCIDRRVAIIAVDPKLDNQDDYSIDFFSQPVDAAIKKVKEAEGETRKEFIEKNDPYHFDEPSKNLLTSYFLRGQQIDAFKSYYQFEEAYPMISDALLYIPGLDPQHAAQEIYNLHKRLAKEIIAVKDYALSPKYLSKFSAIEKEIAPDSLCGILLGIPRPASASVPGLSKAESASCCFVKRGQKYMCRFCGGDIFDVDDLKGVGFIHRLLSNPSQEFSYEQLSPSPYASSVQEWLDNNEIELSKTYYQLQAADKKTIEEVKRARNYLELELEDPLSSLSDEERAKKIDHLNKLNDYLKRVKGKGGNPRKEKTPYQKKRDAVLHNIDNALIAIEEFDKDMAEHLRSQIVRDNVMSYKPISGIKWHTINN